MTKTWWGREINQSQGCFGYGPVAWACRTSKKIAADVWSAAILICWYQILIVRKWRVIRLRPKDSRSLASR